MSRKVYALMGIALITTFVLAACGTTAPATTEAPAATEMSAATEAPTAQPADTEEAKKVTIRWWHIYTTPNQTELMQTMADEYQKAHPNVTIEVTVLENENFKTKLTTAIQSGDPPDLFHSWGGGVLAEYAKAGMLRDISPELKGEWQDSYAEGALAIYGDGTHFYGVPNDLGMIGFWYNKALFKKVGIENPPVTWAELLDDVKKLQAAGITPIAVGGKDKWPAMYYWTYLATRIGGKEGFEAAYTRKGKFTDQPFIDAGNELKKLIDMNPFQSGFLGATYNDEAAAMGNGKAAMELMGQWAPNVEKEESADKKGIGDDLGWFPFPAVDGGKGDITDAMGGGGGIVVGKNAPDEAVDFLHYINTADAQKREAAINQVIPVVKGTDDAITDPFYKIIKANVDKAKYFQLYYDQFLPPATAQVVNDSIQGLFAGKLTPEQLAKAIEDSAAEELK